MTSQLDDANQTVFNPRFPDRVAGVRAYTPPDVKPWVDLRLDANEG